MAIVKKDLFEAGLISAFKEVSVAEAITVKPSRVDGTKITFTKMGNVALHDYTGTIAEDSIETTAIEMLMDKKKYFAVAVDDAEQVFATAELLIPIANEGAYAMKEDVEKAILGEAVKGAKLAGMKVVGVYDTHSDDQKDILKETCDKYILSYNELL